MTDNKYPQPELVGFFPKLVCPTPQQFKSHTIKEICSVSECIAHGPENWLSKWKHNELGFYDTEDLALSVIEANKDRYRLYAYQLFPIEFDNGTPRDYPIPTSVTADISAYTFLGFDLVSRQRVVDFFECSPLSCNYLYKVCPVNQYCLIDELEKAYAYCLEIEKQKCEPGPYYLFEVYRNTG